MLLNIDDSILLDLKQSFDENSSFDSNLATKLQPYFDINLQKADTSSNIQWYYNLFRLSKHVDMGLAHATLQHHIPREYLSHSSLAILKDWTTVGATSDEKPSNNIKLKKHGSDWILDGNINWITNLENADALVTVATEPETGINYRIAIDLKRIEHQVISDVPELVGMKFARPKNIVINNQLLDDQYVIGTISWPKWSDGMFESMKKMHLCFLTNITAAASALIDEIEKLAPSRTDDYSFIIAKNAVMTAIDSWLYRIEEEPSLGHNELYYQRQAQTYTFAKNTLMEVIHLARIYGITNHVVNGDPSRLYRNAVTFSSHQRKVYDFKNGWGDSGTFSSDKYLKHAINNRINNIPFPDSLL